MYNVLLVDDEPRTIDALEKNVDWRGCGIRKLFRSMSMQEAIRVIEKERPEIMVCDIEMPSGSGLQLLEWLREQKKQINCIFVTCHPEFDYMRKAIQLKCYDYILKPINYEDFSRTLTSLVHRLESLEDGQNNDMTTILGSMSDYEIRQHGQAAKERDVEMAVKKYIREHMMDNITVTSIAQSLSFNPQYLMRAFKSKTDLSIVEYITLERMDMAKKILTETSLPIKEVAHMVGYSDYAYFTRVFRKETGESPSQYRGRRQ